VLKGVAYVIGTADMATSQRLVHKRAEFIGAGSKIANKPPGDSGRRMAFIGATRNEYGRFGPSSTHSEAQLFHRPKCSLSLTSARPNVGCFGIQGRICRSDMLTVNRDVDPNKQFVGGYRRGWRAKGHGPGGGRRAHSI
jgi:hypothetical protein